MLMICKFRKPSSEAKRDGEATYIRRERILTAHKPLVLYQVNRNELKDERTKMKMKMRTTERRDGRLKLLLRASIWRNSQ